jgi:hypothetical protein
MPARKQLSTRLRSDFAKRITVEWRKIVQSILEVGRLLLAAKKKLPHGDFTKMVESDLPFGERTAQMLMSIARHPGLTNPHMCAHLPPSWRVLYELSGLPKREFDRAVEVRSIHPEMTVEEAKGLARSRRVQIQITHRTTYVPSVAFLRGEPKPLLPHPVPPTHKLVPMIVIEEEGETRHVPMKVTEIEPRESVLVEQEMHIDDIIETICRVTKADLDLLHKRLTQDRANDIKEFKQGVENLQLVVERLAKRLLLSKH